MYFIRKNCKNCFLCPLHNSSVWHRRQSTVTNLICKRIMFHRLIHSISSMGSMWLIFSECKQMQNRNKWLKECLQCQKAKTLKTENIGLKLIKNAWTAHRSAGMEKGAQVQKKKHLWQCWRWNGNEQRQKKNGKFKWNFALVLVGFCCLQLAYFVVSLSFSCFSLLSFCVCVFTWFTSLLAVTVRSNAEYFGSNTNQMETIVL